MASFELSLRELTKELKLKLEMATMDELMAANLAPTGDTPAPPLTIAIKIEKKLPIMTVTIAPSIVDTIKRHQPNCERRSSKPLLCIEPPSLRTPTSKEQMILRQIG
ncbi:unnamed protein product [Linum trigynum]|uniref:Uncharacterized protein n=1 Tax=Linum trigynum TaxID=586398 RepID=A0AAV2CEA9_9ROSI